MLAVLTFGVVCPGARAAVDSNKLDRAIHASARYLVNACAEDGRFTYRVNTNPRIKPRRQYNIVRHAGAIYALAQYYRYCPCPDVRATLDRTSRFLIDKTIAPLPGRPDLLAVWSLPEITRQVTSPAAKLGASGLGLAALCDVESMLPGTMPEATLEGLGRFLLFMQREDGSFCSKYLREGGRCDEWQSLYYPGEAALGLLKFYRHDPRASEWLHAGAKALAHLVKLRAGGQAVDVDHWALLATDAFLPFYGHIEQPLPRKAYLEHAEAICRRILTERSSIPRRYAPVGCFSSDGRTCPTAIRLEGLLAAQRFLLNADETLLHRMHSTSKSALLFLLAAQKTSGRFTGGMPRAAAGLPESHPLFNADFNARATEIRIDYVQHALSAMLLYADRVFPLLAESKRRAPPRCACGRPHTAEPEPQQPGLERDPES